MKIWYHQERNVCALTNERKYNDVNDQDMLDHGFIYVGSMNVSLVKDAIEIRTQNDLIPFPPTLKKKVEILEERIDALQIQLEEIRRFSKESMASLVKRINKIEEGENDEQS
jgi:hypothetical protein